MQELATSFGDALRLLGAERSITPDYKERLDALFSARLVAEIETLSEGQIQRRFRDISPTAGDPRWYPERLIALTDECMYVVMNSDYDEVRQRRERERQKINNAYVVFRKDGTGGGAYNPTGWKVDHLQKVNDALVEPPPRDVCSNPGA